MPCTPPSEGQQPVDEQHCENPAQQFRDVMAAIGRIALAVDREV